MTYFKYNNKNIFYQEFYEGEPLLLLHGDAVSSKMFEFILPLYSNNKVIVLDFLNTGQSDRVDELSDELWYDQALQTIELIKKLGYKKVNLLGTSGGAYVALNVVLERPDLINKVIADSFDGVRLRDTFIEDLLKEREYAQNDEQSRQFYEWNHGSDWQEVVNKNTKSLIKLAKSNKSLFHQKLSVITNPIFLIGSKEDDMTGDITKEYLDIVSTMKNATMYVFDEGKHPTVLSQAKEVAKLVNSYLNK